MGRAITLHVNLDLKLNFYFPKMNICTVLFFDERKEITIFMNNIREWDNVREPKHYTKNKIIYEERDINVR